MSSHVKISCGIKLFRVLKVLTFSFTLLFEKALVQLNSLNALRITSILASLIMIPNNFDPNFDHDS